MDNINQAYISLLHFGLLILRNANDSGDQEWVNAEIELLHNIPSLINENNRERHRYFWEGERQLYLDWIARSCNKEAQTKMSTYYVPLWKELGRAFADAGWW
jgi:hypothetical protein